MAEVKSTEPRSLNTETPKDAFKRILLLGDSGSGKTTFCGTAPNPFFADFDGGLETLAGHPTAKAKDFASEGWDAFIKEKDLWRKEGPQYGCETFILDSVTTAGDACLDHIMSKKGAAGGQPGIAEWGDAIRKMKDVLAHLSTLRCHVIVNAHLMVVTDEVLGGNIWLPMMYGRELPGKMPIYFRDVWLTNIELKQDGGQPKPNYRVQVMPDQRVKIIKSSQKGRTEKYEVPDFMAIMDKAKSQFKEGK